MTRTDKPEGDESLQQAFRRRLRRAGYAPLAMMLAFAVTSGLAVSQMMSRARWVDHTRAVIAQANRCFLLAVDLQAGLRGYQLTGSTNFLSPYLSARTRGDIELQQLEHMVGDNPQQRALVSTIHRKLGDFTVFAERTIERRRTGQDVFDVALNHEGKTRFDEIRELFGTFTSAEESLLHSRTATLTKASRAVVAFRFTGAIGLAALLAWFIRRQLRSMAGAYDAALRDLRSSADTLAVTLRSLGDGVIATDSTGRVTFMNPVAETLTGWAAAEARGQSVESVCRIVSEDDGAPVERPVARVLQAGNPVDLAMRPALIHRSGRRCSVTADGAPIRNRDGSVSGVVMIFRDVTAERAAQTERDRLVAVVEHSSDFIAMADLQGNLTYLNSAGGKLIGLGEGENFRRLTFTDYVPESWLDFFHNTVLPTTRQRGLWEGEMQLRNLQTGATIDVLRSTFVIKDPHSGEPTGFATVTRDITERKRAERALSESEQRFRALADNIPQLVWMANPDGGVFWYNKRWFDYTGTRLEEVQHWQWRQVHHPDHLARVEAGFRQAIESGESWEDTFPLRSREGGYRWFLSRAFPIRDTHGQIVRWFGTNTDITHIREAENAVRASEERYRKLSTELEHRVEERTRELTGANEQLHEANHRLQEIDRLKSEFLATMSHELRTPLNSIIGFTEIVKAGLAGPLNAEQNKQLSMSLNSARHLLHLINDLLDLARIESGRVEVVREPFDLREAIDQVLQTLRPLAAQKDLPVETQVQGDTQMFSDRKMVFQILLNLANNAVKFTDRGTVRIMAARENGSLRIDVTDTGIGIKPENLQLLFEAFRQVDGSARRRFEGTGLGLHLSKRLVALLGGEITVESTYGEGSKFTVRLPAQTCAP